MMTAHTLVLLAHPDLTASRIHARLAVEAREADGVTVHDLSAASTDGRVDVALEQQLLLDHDHIVWQFPWYWYSVPAVLKAWMDQVLTYGFAYGQDGTALRGKSLRLVTSTGGPAASYGAGGHNRFTMPELLHPLEATAHLCGLELREPLVLHGARVMADVELEEYAGRYRRLLAGRQERAAA
jgi:putative NADPH-quinone reductase